MTISISNTQTGSSNVYGSNSAGVRRFTGEFYPLTYSRQQVSLSLSAGGTIVWVLGTAGPGSGYVVVANGDTGASVSYVGPLSGYSGPTPTVRVAGNIGLGLVGGSYTGSQKTVQLSGSGCESCAGPNNTFVNADDYCTSLLLQANGLV